MKEDKDAQPCAFYTSHEESTANFRCLGKLHSSSDIKSSPFTNRGQKFRCVGWTQISPFKEILRSIVENMGTKLVQTSNTPLANSARLPTGT